MHTSTAFERRDTLSVDDLTRLKRALEGEVERYKDSIRGYKPDKMERYGKPFLTALEDRVVEVDRVIARRA